MQQPPLATTRRAQRPPGNSTRRRRHLAVAASAALAASVVASVPASATITGDVRDGANITVFHNIDFVAVFGYGAVGEPITVDVLRDGVLIGTANGPAVDAEGLPGLEVNHGPEVVPPNPGDCWTGTTPDIQPGDVIQVTTSDGDVDEVTVDDIRFTGDPFEAGNGDILVPFDAFLANGNPVPVARIDSAEFRAASNNQVRFEGPDVVVQRRPGGVPGEYQMRYRSPFRPSRNDDENPFGQAQLRRALLGDGHAIGFGHTDPLPLESMLVDGLADTPGPAPGCEAAPSARWGVTTVSPASINLGNQDRGITVRGVSHDATEVRVDLTDAAGNVVTKAAALAGTGAQNWAIPFTQAQLAALDGNITVAGFYTLADGTISGANATLVKDLVRPDVPTASVPAGTYRRTQRVALRAAAGEEIRYTLGNGRQARPTRNRGTLYQRRIRITSSQVLKMVSVDEAGNVSPVTRVRYRIANVPTRPRIRQALSGDRGGVNTAVARWRPPRSTNGTRVSGYRVIALKVRRNGSVVDRRSTRTASDERSAEMRLRRGRYEFRVRALSPNGSSAMSRRSNTVRSR